MVWPLRRAGAARALLRWLGRMCGIALAIVFVVTVCFVWAFGHPLAMSVVGCLFAALPLAGLGLAAAVWWRATVAAGPRWIGVRFVRRWRVVDLGQVRAVHLAGGELPGFAWFGGTARGRAGGRVVLEDEFGTRLDVDLDALGAGMADVLVEGLPPDALVDPEAAGALDEARHREDDPA